MCFPNRAVKAVVAAVIGDKLGAHVIGGFVENFRSCEHFCRFCDVSWSDFAVNPLAVGVAQAPTSHNADIQTVCDSECTMGRSNGIRGSSPLNKLSFFHVAAPGLPPCLRYDLLQGIVD